jgi:hypothetical protein
MLGGPVDDDAHRALRSVPRQQDDAPAEAGVDDAVGRHQEDAGLELLPLVAGARRRSPPRRIGRDETEERRDERRPEGQSCETRHLHAPPSDPAPHRRLA